MGSRGNKRGGLTGSEHSEANTARSVSPVVGIILLFGMVFIGAAIVATAGMVVMDDVETASAAEQSKQCTLETDHRIATVLANDGMKEFPCDGGDYASDGSMYVVWHDGTSDPNLLNAFPQSTAKIDELGAIKYSIGGEAYAYQAGGVWKGSGSSVEPLSSPPISYNPNSDTKPRLEINPVVMNGSRADQGVQTLSRGSGTGGAGFASAQEHAASNGYTNLTIVVESEYHEGWEQYFESNFAGNATVTGSSSLMLNGVDNDRAVAVEISNAMDPSPRFQIDSDNGLVGPTALKPDVLGTKSETDLKPGRRAAGNKLRVETDIRNVGHQSGRTDISFNIPGTTVTKDTQSGTISAGTVESETIVLSHSKVKDLTPGEVYEYNISTDDDFLDTHGSFLYATHEAPYLQVTNPRVDGDDASDDEDPLNATEENATLSVDVHNTGASDVDGASLDLDIDVPGTDNPYNLSTNRYTVDRQYGENATVTWSVNRSTLLEGEHEFTVTSANGSDVSGHFVVENGVDIGDTELRLDPGTTVNATVAGTEMSDSNRGRDGEHTAGYPVTDKGAGKFTTSEDGMAFSFDASAPESEQDEMEISEDGGWVAPDGTTPEVESDCHWLWGCDYSWTWDTNELVWNDDAGYSLTWTHGGDWGWDGETGSTLVPAGESTELVVDTRSLPQYQVEWVPGSATLITQQVNEENEAIGEPTPISDVDWHDTNLNVEKGTSRPVYEHSFRTTERVSFQMEASSHIQGGDGFCGRNPTRTSREIIDGNIYANQYCPGEDAVTGGDLVNLNADTETESTNVRVLKDGDQLPTIESGSEWQRDVDELLGREAIDVSVREDGTLDLSSNEFIFAFELTHHPEQYNEVPTVDEDITADEYWNLAQSRNGDPNFNDMLVHVEIRPPAPTEDFGFSGAYDSGSGTVSIGPGSSDDNGGSDGDTDGIDIGSDEIIIG